MKYPEELGQINTEIPLWRKLLGVAIIGVFAYAIYTDPRIKAEIMHRKKGWK